MKENIKFKSLLNNKLKMLYRNNKKNKKWYKEMII